MSFLKFEARDGYRNCPDCGGSGCSSCGGGHPNCKGGCLMCSGSGEIKVESNPPLAQDFGLGE